MTPARTPRTTLRVATIAFAAAFGVHAIDHLRRGFDRQSPVYWGGMAQGIAAIVVLGLVLREHRSAATAAMWLGFASVIVFGQAHVLPAWGPVGRDSFWSAGGVTWFSWVTAVLEMGMGFVLGVVAARSRRGVMEVSHAS